MPLEIFNFPFAARLDQSKDPKQLDVGFTALVNCSFDYDGAISKRPGLELAWVGGSTSYDSPERLMPVGKTLAMLGGASPTSVDNDSQMGNVSLYSNKLDAWAGSGDWIQWVSPMWVEREDMAAHLDSTLVTGDVAFCNGYIVQAWIRRDVTEVGTNEVVIRVIDSETGTVRDERVRDTATKPDLGLGGIEGTMLRALKCTKAASINVVCVSWIADSCVDSDGTVGLDTSTLRRCLVTLSGTAPSFGSAGDLRTGVADYYDIAPGPSASLDQQWIVGVEVNPAATPCDLDFLGFDSSATLVKTYATLEDHARPGVTTVGTLGSGSLGVAISLVDGATGNIDVHVYSQTALVVSTPIAAGEGGGDTDNIRDTSIVHIPDHGDNDCLVSWTYLTTDADNEILGWARTDHDGVAPVGAVSRTRRLRLYSHMVYFAERTYVCVCDGELGKGADWPASSQMRLHWVNLPIATGDDSPAFRPVPVASSQLGLPTLVYNDGAAGTQTNIGVLRSISHDSLHTTEIGRFYQAVVTQHPAIGTVTQNLVQSQQMTTLHFQVASGNFATNDLGRAVQLGGQTYVAGGYVSQFDDVRFFESGFMQAPGFSAEKVDTPGGAAVTNGTYDIKVVYEFLDDSDQLQFSLESGPVSVTTDGANADAVDVTIEPLTLTLKQQKFYDARKVLLGVYVRQGNEVYRRWTQFDYVSADADQINDPESLDEVVLRFIADPDDTAPELYTNGDRLVTDVIPGATTICAHKGRLWAAGGEDGEVIYYSLESREGEPACFNLAQFIRISGVRIVALVELDEILYAFTREAIYRIFGEGPDDAGHDGSFTFQRLTSDVGMQWPRAWCVGRDGIYFIGRKGFYLLTRAQTIQYLGAPVETSFTTFYDWRAAVVIDSRHEIRFYGGSSLGVNAAVAYDYEIGAWSVWVYDPPSDGVSADAVLWNGDATLLTTGSVSVIGKVYQDGAAYRDDTRFYAMTLTTGEVRFGRTHELKRLQRVHLLHNRTAGNGGVSIAISVPGRPALSTQTETWTEAQLDADLTKDRVRMHVTNQKFLGWSLTVTEIEPTAVPVWTSAPRWSGLAFQVRPIGGVGRANDTVSR